MSKVLQVRVSDKDHALMVSAAGVLGIKLSEYVRRKLTLEELVVGRPVVAESVRFDGDVAGVRERLGCVDFASEEPAKTELVTKKTVLTAVEMNAAFQEIEVVYDDDSDDPNKDKPLF